MTTPTTSARLDEFTEKRVTEIVKQRGMTRSDWLREAVDVAINAERDGAKLTDISKRLDAMETGIKEALKTANESLNANQNLSNRIDVERAADRAVNQQIYRMAFRAAYLLVKQISDEAPEGQRGDLGLALCDEADDLCYDDGYARLEQVMRDAREDLRQSIERGGTS